MRRPTTVSHPLCAAVRQAIRGRRTARRGRSAAPDAGRPRGGDRRDRRRQRTQFFSLPADGDAGARLRTRPVSARAGLAGGRQCAWLPFGGGVRRCIGAGFSLMEGTAVLREILTRYALSLPP